ARLAVNSNFLVFSVSSADMMGQSFASLVPTVAAAESAIGRKSLGKTFKETPAESGVVVPAKMALCDVVTSAVNSNFLVFSVSSNDMMGQSSTSLVPIAVAAESAIGVRAFLAGRAHPILKSFPKPLHVQLLKDREKAFQMRLSYTNMRARKMLFAAILSIYASSSKKISIYNEEMIVARCFIGFIIFTRCFIGFIIFCFIIFSWKSLGARFLWGSIGNEHGIGVEVVEWPGKVGRWGCEGWREKRAGYMALPPKEKRYLWLRYQVNGYTKEIVQDFKLRLGTIFSRRVNRVHVLDFAGMTKEMGKTLDDKMRMVYTEAEGHVLFNSHAWGRLLKIRALLVRKFILEFFSTYRISDTELGLDVADTLCFQLGEARRRMT
nr:ATPase subunit 4, mitochondrial [Tanacetum cinerariifolium]